MPANALVQARIDSAIKKEAAAALAEAGLTISDAVRLMLTRVARERQMPFDVFRPNAETIAAMEDARAGRNMKSFDSVEALMADLNADDEDD